MEPNIGINNLYILTFPGGLYLSSMYQRVNAAADIKAAYNSRLKLAILKFKPWPFRPILPIIKSNSEPENICPPDSKNGLMSADMVFTYIVAIVLNRAEMSKKNLPL